jgi:hypothetical protein
MWGVVRQQLLVHPDIPFTSHNSSACAVIEVPGPEVRHELVDRAGAHVRRHMVEGSDPGVCVALEGDEALARLVPFGRLAATRVTTQVAALEAAAGVHLAGYGGTNDGIIGAAAGVGLTFWGWAGRFVEYGDLRAYPDPVRVGDLEDAGIIVLALDRNIGIPAPDDLVETQGWLRPRLWGGEPGLPVLYAGPGRWRAVVSRPSAEDAEPEGQPGLEAS